MGSIWEREGLDLDEMDEYPGCLDAKFVMHLSN